MVDVAQVVREQHGAREQARDRTTPPRLLRHGVCLHVRRTDRRDEAEEHEDEQLSEPGIAVRTPSAGVGPRGHDARGAHQQQPPVARAHDDRSAGDRGDREPREGDRQHRARCGLARGGEAGGADALVVGAADAVAVVVGVVHTDLQGDRHDQAAQRDHPVELGARDEGRSRADDDRGDRERQGAQARRADPVARRRRCNVRGVARDVRALGVAVRLLLLRTALGAGVLLLAGAACHPRILFPPHAGAVRRRRGRQPGPMRHHSSERWCRCHLPSTNRLLPPHRSDG